MRIIIQAWLEVLWINNEEDLWELDLDDQEKLCKLTYDCAFTKRSFEEDVDLNKEVRDIMESL